MAKSPSEAKKENQGEPAQVRVRWDDSKMANTYANVCNVSSTREEVTLLFGTNKNWHTAQTDFTVELSNRIILNPYAAKRLLLLLGNVVRQYESRFGKLEVDVGAPGAPDQGAQ
jgi:hypothetical protein